MDDKNEIIFNPTTFVCNIYICSICDSQVVTCYSLVHYVFNFLFVRSRIQKLYTFFVGVYICAITDCSAYLLVALADLRLVYTKATHLLANLRLGFDFYRIHLKLCSLLFLSKTGFCKY